MSNERMSFEDAKAFVKKLQEQNVQFSEIRRQMVDKGFSYAEIYKLSGKEQTPFKHIQKTKIKNEQVNDFEAGGCLKFYLQLLFVEIGLVFLLYSAMLIALLNNEPNPLFITPSPTVLIIFLIFYSFQLLCIYSLSAGKRWGYYGFILLTIINATVIFFTTIPYLSIIYIVIVVILIILVYPKRKMLT